MKDEKRNHKGILEFSSYSIYFYFGKFDALKSFIKNKRVQRVASEPCFKSCIFKVYKNGERIYE